ncbi:MAG: EAL domain-containing protein [Candidatus Thiodiazotropha sp.]
MSNDKTVQQTAKPDLVHTFLNQVPGRVSAILENWHQLVHSDWKGNLLDTLIERITTLDESGNKFGVPQIAQSGKSLIAHLSDYHGTGLKPQHDDVVALDGLVHAFKDAAIQACNQQAEALASAPVETSKRAAASSGEQKVFILGIDEALAANLTRHLQAHRFDVHYLTDVEQIIHHFEINPDEKSFLISHVEMLGKLFPESKEGGLWNKNNGLPGMPVAFIADNSDLKTRLSAMRVDASAYWVKPVDPYLAAKRIHELSTSHSHAAYRILIVEDDPAQADFADAILSKANFECRSVIDPLQVMDVLQEFKPDLILMDLYMPEASGTELTTVIREDNAFVDIPIVFLSGEHDLDKQLSALSFGGEDFLSKPIAPKHLITTVTNRIRRARQLSYRLHGHTRGEKEIGLHSRNYLLERLDALLNSESPIDEVTGIYFIKIDNQEDLIKTVGIGGLDAVLAVVASHLKQNLQSQDILTRFGDNSLSLLALRPSIDDLQSLGESLCQSVSKEIIEVENSTVGVTLSIGIYPVDNNHHDSSSIIAHAQSASRSAQDEGGNQVSIVEKEVASPEDSGASASEDIGSLIEKALKHDYFDIYFQPVVALQGSTQAHYQTLLRLKEPDGKLHRAAEFIPKAEELGLISKVDQWTIRRALHVTNEHMNQGNRLHLFISQSTDLLDNMERLSYLREKHRQRLIHPESLTFEFNINEVARNLKSAKICFDVLNKINITTLLTRVTSSVETERVIEHLPIKYIKLDFTLLQDPEQGLKKLIELAHGKGIKVIAPQVEDPRSIAVLWSSGTDYVQGNFVQRPESNLIYDFNESVL